MLNKTGNNIPFAEGVTGSFSAAGIYNFTHSENSEGSSNTNTSMLSLNGSVNAEKNPSLKGYVSGDVNFFKTGSKPQLTLNSQAGLSFDKNFELGRNTDIGVSAKAFAGKSLGVNDGKIEQGSFFKGRMIDGTLRKRVGRGITLSAGGGVSENRTDKEFLRTYQGNLGLETPSRQNFNLFANVMKNGEYENTVIGAGYRNGNLSVNADLAFVDSTTFNSAGVNAAYIF